MYGSKWDFPRLAEEVALSERVCIVAWVPFGSFQIRDVQQICRRVRLETLCRRKRRAQKGPALQMPCSSFWMAQDFAVRTDRVLRRSDNSGLWLLTACMYNLVAADLEYTLKLGIHVCGIRMAARL